MGLTTTFAIYVSLFAATLTADWTSVHNEGIEAAKRGEATAAARLFQQAAPLAETPSQIGIAANDLGLMLHQLSRDAEARVQLEKALRIWQENPGNEVGLAETAETLAIVCRTLGDYSTAERVLRLALKTPPASPVRTAFVRNELGDLLRETGHTGEARQLFEQTANAQGISTQSQLDALIGIGDIDRDSPAWQNSFNLWNKALEIAQQQHMPAFEAAAVRGMGLTYLHHGEVARAEPLLRKALARFETLQNASNEIANSLNCLAQLYLVEGKLGLAEDQLVRAMDLLEKTFGVNHPQQVMIIEMLGAVAMGRRQFSMGRDYFDHARSIMAARFGESSTFTAAVDATRGFSEQSAKLNNDAAANFERALAVLDAAGPDTESLRRLVEQHYSEVCKALHRPDPKVTHDPKHPIDDTHTTSEFPR